MLPRRVAEGEDGAAVRCGVVVQSEAAAVGPVDQVLAGAVGRRGASRAEGGEEGNRACDRGQRAEGS